MANSYFKFKQFTIQQDKCAMKVCTDACLFGVWINIPNHTKHILDIGTGTGLLSLMLAQKSEKYISIDAVELEENAFEQAINNFTESTFAERIKGIHVNFFNYKTEKKYDILVCNPPFYKQQLATQNKANILARHSDDFDFNDFFFQCSQLSNEAANLFLLMPFYRKNEIEKIALQNKWYPKEITLVVNKIGQQPIRVMFHFVKNIEIQVLKNELIIYQENNAYTDEFKEKLSPFYFNL